MFKNYIKIAIRNLKKSKLYSFINITGLSVGIASCMLIFLYIKYEMSYDRYNKNAGQIYRLTEILHLPKEDNARAVSAPPMAPLLQESLPEIRKTVRINFSQRILSYKESKLYDAKVIYADSTLFDIFTFPMLSGNPQTALVNPYSIVLTESTAKKYFGNAPALGRNMKLSDTINLTVTGIIKDIPLNSHINFDCVLSRTTILEMNHHQSEADNWYNNNYYTYILLPENYPYRELEPKINQVIDKAMQVSKKESGLSYDFKLQPVTDIHLRSNLHSEINPNSDISYIYIFTVAAILILLVACSNFINLSTARSINRSKEIGLRKVVGAARSQLITQFFGESFLFTLIAAVLAIVLVALVIPSFSSFTGRPLFMSDLADPVSILIYLGIIISVGFLAGIYPALQLSSFGPIKALKGNIKHEWQDIFLRKGLVIFQFTIAIILIAGTSLVFQQLRFMQNQKLGLNKDQVLEIELKNKDLPQSETLLKELQNDPAVIHASCTDFSFKNNPSSVAMLPEGASENEVTSQNVITVDENFLPTFQIPLAAGRNFSKSFATDTREGFIVNEAAVQTFGWKTAAAAIGKNIDWGLGKKGKVVGVVKNFNFSSLHNNIRPLIIHILPDWYQYVAIRVKADDLPATIKTLENTWKKIAINSPFVYSFMDDDFANLYKSEQNMQAVLSLFTLLSILISCLGLFGLASFTIRQRVKEIGVRKVLGASESNIVRLLSKDFLKLVFIAVFIGSAIAYIAIHKWLQGFAYHIHISWWIFLGAGFLAVTVAFVTVSFLAVKAAVANPVKSLRTE